MGVREVCKPKLQGTGRLCSLVRNKQLRAEKWVTWVKKKMHGKLKEERRARMICYASKLSVLQEKG